MTKLARKLLLLNKPAVAGGGGGGGSAYQALILADGPLMYYRLGEASGVTAVDASGHGNDGTYAAAPTLGVPGLITGDSDMAVTFTRAQSEGVLTNYVPGHPAFSCEAWFKTTNAVGRHQIINQDDAFSARRFQFRLQDGKASFLVFDTVSSFGFIEQGVSLANGVKHHMVGTFDVDRRLRVYVDGVLIATSGVIGAALSPNLTLKVACDNYQGAGTNTFDGTLDEVAYYPTALTLAQVQAHYNQGA